MYLKCKQNQDYLCSRPVVTEEQYNLYCSFVTPTMSSPWRECWYIYINADDNIVARASIASDSVRTPSPGPPHSTISLWSTVHSCCVVIRLGPGCPAFCDQSHLPRHSIPTTPSLADMPCNVKCSTIFNKIKNHVSSDSNRRTPAKSVLFTSLETKHINILIKTKELCWCT